MKRVRRLLDYVLNPRSGYKGLVSNDLINNHEAPSGSRGGSSIRDVILNFPLITGAILVTGLFLVVLFGPLWAPINPYIAGEHIVPHYDPKQEVWISPPLEPSSAFPLGTDEWGNDILSMLLYGARNTLIASVFITMVRVLLGVMFGSISGWNEGRTSDRLLTGFSGVITAVPMLISSMLIIYALDIRRGLGVFISALAVIGWTEIAQYIRAEFIVLRKMPFIDGARAVGARNFAIAVRHVLPNILPQLLVITFLELGAVLMLLGELAFIGVYIGGGSHIALGDEITGVSVLTLAEIPEWGAMLAEGYRWLRAKPFIVFPPAIAFFISVFAFNAFGEGIRRLLEVRHVSMNFLLRKRMIFVIAVISFVTLIIINNTGPAPWFEKVALAFESSSAYTFTQELSMMEGRGIGQGGSLQAANYIESRFKQFGLDPGWRHSEYIYPLETSIARPLQQPELAIVAANGQLIQSFHHQLDFGYQTAGHAGGGMAISPVTFLGFLENSPKLNWDDYKGLDLRGRILMLIDGNAPPGMVDEALIRGASGILLVAREKNNQSQITLSSITGDALEKPTLPVFSISPDVAQSILKNDNLTLDGLLSSSDSSETNQRNWIRRDLQTLVKMELVLEEPHQATTPAVLGYLPGSDFELANELVVLYAYYDGLGTDPDGTVFEAANHNASGISVLLEIARLWQEQSLDVRRSVLFVAWGTGALENKAPEEFLADPASIRHLPAPSSTRRLAPAIIIQVDYAGAGGDLLVIHPNSNNRLIDLFQETGAQIGVQTIIGSARTPAPTDIFRLSRVPGANLGWIQADVRLDEDTLDRIEQDKLQSYGEILSLVLTRIVRESRY